MPLLLQTVEKAAAQNSQHALLAEGVAASVLLSRLALLETQPGEAGMSTVTFSHLWRLLENPQHTSMVCDKDFFNHCRTKVLQLLEHGVG